MREWTMESYIMEMLAGNTQRNALDFLAFLRSGDMQIERGKGYWQDKLYWLVRHTDEYVCFIQILDGDGISGSWTVWSDDSDSQWYSDCISDESVMEIARKHVDFCGNCGGGCAPGKSKTLFGREFDNVCRTTMRFDDPDATTVKAMVKLMELRIDDIDKSKRIARIAVPDGKAEH